MKSSNEINEKDGRLWKRDGTPFRKSTRVLYGSFWNKIRQVVKRKMAQDEEIPSWRPLVGDSVEGVLIWKGINKTKYGDRMTFLLRQEDDSVIKVWATWKIQTYMVGKPIGSFVYIKYKGEIKTRKDRTMKDFEIKITKPDDMVGM